VQLAFAPVLEALEGSKTRAASAEEVESELALPRVVALR
jgi:hypothetical protein